MNEGSKTGREERTLKDDTKSVFFFLIAFSVFFPPLFPIHGWIKERKEEKKNKLCERSDNVS